MVGVSVLNSRTKWGGKSLDKVSEGSFFDSISCSAYWSQSKAGPMISSLLRGDVGESWGESSHSGRWQER